jgi:predicted MPP superfamily phosphohydrolase
VLFCLLSLGGSIISVCTLGRSVYRWHGFAIELRLLPAAQGETRLALIPLGEVRAHTHLAPVALVATLQEIRIDEIQKLLRGPLNREDLAQDFTRAARADLRAFVLRQLAVAALGALIAPLLLRSRRARSYLGSALIGTLAVAAMLGNVLTTFDAKAFGRLTYTGTLKQAPWVIRFSKDAFAEIDTLSQKLRTVASSLNTLYGRIERLPMTPDDGPDTFRILHVSDIHDNPAALAFLREVADQFKVELIVDTGDLTDHGSLPELEMVKRIARLPYPYVFVPGNHDSQTIAKAMAQVRTVTLLKGEPVTVGDLTLLGLSDPASSRPGDGNVVANLADLQAGGQTLLQKVASLPLSPDIIAIHDPAEAEALWGRVPLILCGHELRAYIQMKTAPPVASGVPLTGGAPELHAAYNTIICNAGTTGAAGVRYLDRQEGVPFSCAVLTFSRPRPADTASGTSPVAGNTAASSPSAGAARSDATLAPTGTEVGQDTKAQPAGATRPRLRSIDMIVLNGALDEYSITHYTFASTASNGGDEAKTKGGL